MKTKAAVVFERSGKFQIDQIEISEPNNDEVLVRIAASGICHTDLAGREQYLPIPPGRTAPRRCERVIKSFMGSFFASLPSPITRWPTRETSSRCEKTFPSKSWAPWGAASG